MYAVRSLISEEALMGFVPFADFWEFCDTDDGIQVFKKSY